MTYSRMTQRRSALNLRICSCLIFQFVWTPPEHCKAFHIPQSLEFNLTVLLLEYKKLMGPFYHDFFIFCICKSHTAYRIKVGSRGKKAVRMTDIPVCVPIGADKVCMAFADLPWVQKMSRPHNTPQ